MTQANRPADRPLEHTDADPSHVTREEYVDNDDKALPSDNRSSLFLSIAAAALAVLGIIFAFIMDWDLVGFIVTLLGLITGTVGIAAAYGDARTGIATPSLVTAIVAIVTIIVLMDLLDAEERATTPGEVLVPEATVLEPL